jgi:hypothetical protein
MDTVIALIIIAAVAGVVYLIVRRKGGDLNAKLRSIFKKDE